MKDIELAKKLLAELKSLTSNDFELHRVEVLEKDLTEGLPVVEVIDDNHQKFNGIIYYSDKQGHFHKNIQLHRAVWAYYNGEIGMTDLDIHHIDINPANNDIKNLQVVTRAEHQKIHSSQRMKMPLEKICPICGETFIRKEPNSKYCSRECYKKSRYTFSAQEKCCLICSKKFFTTPENPEQRYCSRECASQAKTFHNRNKICPVCHKSFISPAIKPHQIYCSRACSAKGHTQTRIEKNCPVCGKSFQVNALNKRQKICCSKSCAQKYRWKQLKNSQKV